MFTHKYSDRFSRRAFHCFLILLILVMTTPCQSVIAGTTSTSSKSAKVKPFVLTSVKARPKPSLALVQRAMSLSTNPTDFELSKAQVLPEQLVPISTIKISGENAALAKALMNFKNKKNPEDVSTLYGFIKAFRSHAGALALSST